MGKIIAPKPWLRARRDEQLKRLHSSLANASTDDERTDIEERMKEVRKEYRRDLRNSRRVPW